MPRAEGQKPGAACQYFELSPRQSLESPTRRAEEGANENAEHNVKRSGNSSKAIPKKCAKTNDKKAIAPMVKTPTANRKRVEQAPQGPSTSKSAAALGSGVATPHKAKSGTGPDCSSMQQSPGRQSMHSLLMTPRNTIARTPTTTPKKTPGTRCHNEPDMCNSSVYSACPSALSELSHATRLDQLSRRVVSKKQLSSEELEELAVEEKKQEVRRLLRRNQANCRKAILGPGRDMAASGRAQSDQKLTEPKEFNLLTLQRSPRSPAPSCAASDVGSLDDLDLNTSVLSVRSTKWKPQLTVPTGPDLWVERRLSGGRRLSRGLSEEPELASESRMLTRAQSARTLRQGAQEASAANSLSVFQNVCSSGLTRQEQAGKSAQKRKEELAMVKKESTISLCQPQSARGGRRASFGSATARPCCV